MKVKIYCINKGQSGQYFGLKNIENNQILQFAPNNWKTIQGAERWARRHGLTMVQEKELP